MNQAFRLANFLSRWTYLPINLRTECDENFRACGGLSNYAENFVQVV